MSVSIYTGTRAPSLTDTITVNGAAFDLSGCTVDLRMRPVGSDTLKVDAAATVVSAAAGTVRYDWASADLDTPGSYRAWWRVTLASAKVQESAEFDVEVLEHDPGARSTMAALITRVRGLVGDPAGDTAVFTDAQVQDVLDRHRIDVVHEPLAPDEDWTGSGVTQWKVYRSRWRHFEATDGGSAIFVVEDGIGDNRGTATWTADYQRGMVTFAADQGGTALYLSGRSYDPHGAAAELLEGWAAKVAVDYDFQADGQRFDRSQKAASLREQAGVQRRRARARRVRMR